jgi:hypothetical protein
MRNLEEDKKFVVNGNHLPLCETELIAVHAIDRAIASEIKLELAVKVMEGYANKENWTTAYYHSEFGKAQVQAMYRSEPWKSAQSVLEEIKSTDTNAVPVNVVEHYKNGLEGFCINCIDEEDTGGQGKTITLLSRNDIDQKYN